MMSPYVAPYLGGSVIEGIAPPLPIPGTQYVLQLAQGSSTYGTILSDAIPPLFPVFGYGEPPHALAGKLPPLSTAHKIHVLTV